MDERVAITQESIQIALLQLMDEQGFQKVSVSGIARRAGVNRTTFYLHYTDKYDLLNKIEEELLAEIQRSIATGLDRVQSASTALHTIQETIIKTLSFIQEKQFEFTVLFGPKGAPDFSAKYGKMIEEVFSTHRIPFTHAIPTDYLTAVVSGAHIGILRVWVLSGMRESPEEMATIISAFIQGVLKEAAKLQAKTSLLKGR